MAKVRSACPPPTDRRRVIIAGGGYAGTTAAVSLGRALKRSGDADIDVLVVEPNPCQEALSELDLVAVGPQRPEFCELWHTQVFRGLPVTMCYNRISDVRPAEHAVVIGDGDGEVVPYWRLVIATGAIPFLPPVPGIKEHAITMWSVEDAKKLQHRILESFREAATIADRDRRREVLCFAVVGGGATGVEIMGTLARLLPVRMREQGLDPADLQLRLVEGRPDILYDLQPRLRHIAIQRLESMGVQVVTGSMVDRIEEGAIRLKNGSMVCANTLVWAGGAKADPHAIDWGLQAAPDGRLVVDQYLKPEGFDDIYVIGDVAHARHPKTNKTLPMLAQVAIQEGPHTASNILREARGEAPTPYQPHLRGEFVSIGPRTGVGWMYGLQLTGIPAITMKRITYLKYWFQVGGVGLTWRRTREMVSMSR